jgi:hypothetical protein
MDGLVLTTTCQTATAVQKKIVLTIFFGRLNHDFIGLTRG